MDRLDKILVSQNVGSRKEVQKLIKDGAVCVNGECIKQPQHKVDAVADDITVGGQPLFVQQICLYNDEQTCRSSIRKQR